MHSFKALRPEFTNDASMIIPTANMGTDYTAVGVPTRAGNGLLDTVTIGVVVVEDDTNVTIKYANGTTIFEGTYNQGDYVESCHCGSSICGRDTNIAGTSITSSKPVAAYESYGCIRLIDSYCDHIYHQMIPQKVLAKSFFAVPSAVRPSGCTGGFECVGDLLHFVATEDNTTITANLAPDGMSLDDRALDGIMDDTAFTKQKGEAFSLFTSSPFGISADKPLAAMQFVVSRLATGPADTNVTGSGDPA